MRADGLPAVRFRTGGRLADQETDPAVQPLNGITAGVAAGVLDLFFDLAGHEECLAAALLASTLLLY